MKDDDVNEYDHNDEDEDEVNDNPNNDQYHHHQNNLHYCGQIDRYMDGWVGGCVDRQTDRLIDKQAK